MLFGSGNTSAKYLNPWPYPLAEANQTSAKTRKETAERIMRSLIATVIQCYIHIEKG